MCFLLFTSLKLISAKQRVPNFRTPAIGKIAKTYWATNSDTPLGQNFTTISWVTMRRWHQILSCGPRWSFSSYPPPLDRLLPLSNIFFLQKNQLLGPRCLSKCALCTTQHVRRVSLKDLPHRSLLDQMFSTSQVDSDASVWSEKARKAIIAHDKEHMRSCLGKGGSAEKTKARKGKEDRVDIWHDSSSISDFWTFLASSNSWN